MGIYTKFVISLSHKIYLTLALTSILVPTFAADEIDYKTHVCSTVKQTGFIYTVINNCVLAKVYLIWENRCEQNNLHLKLYCRIKPIHSIKYTLLVSLSLSLCLSLSL
jgi:hypothetical protein